MKTGIMGGTFNPIHNAHIKIALSAKKQYCLDRIIFITGGNPPHKTADVTADDRFKMTSLAIKSIEGFEDDDFEVNRTEKSYSLHTFKYLREKYPDDELFFIIGEDSLVDLNKWYKPEEILELCSLLVFPRNSLKTLDEEIKSAMQIYGNKIFPINAPIFDISSTEIRKKLSENKSVDGLIPENVYDYIKRNGLYRNTLQNDYKKQLKQRLTKNRYLHSISVADTAVKLAGKYNADENKAYAAGILHDCAKDIPIDEQINLCKEYGLDIESMIDSPGIIHAPLGEKIAKMNFGITDDEILSAIRRHTTGAENMSVLDKIIYLADMIEPLRNFDGVEELRQLSDEDINVAFLTALKQSILFNTNKNRIIHLDTISAWNYELKMINKGGIQNDKA